MLDWIIKTVDALGYGGIALLMFLENLIPPIPSELIMPLAGFTAARGGMSLPAVIAAGVFGSVLGALPWYYVGKRIGHMRLRAWAEAHGKWLTISGADVDSAKHWFDTHGRSCILFGRLLPGLRTLISAPAGAADMNLASFLVYSAIGTLVWTAVLASLGHVLGENYQTVSRYLGPASAIVFTAVALLITLQVLKRRRRDLHRRRQANLRR